MIHSLRMFKHDLQLEITAVHGIAHCTLKPHRKKQCQQGDHAYATQQYCNNTYIYQLLSTYPAWQSDKHQLRGTSQNAAASHKTSDALKLKTICTQCLLKTKFNSSTAFVLTVQPRATELLYSVRAPPAPTPSVEPSPPIEISTGGLISEHFARACSNTTAQQYQWSNSWTNS